ncbi:PIN domain-containing protein [Aerolutibacter daejeonensis]|uniref:PIN domain-containing protein n=1 Tax=Aerolutibacter daejeonensis TaxID=346181 RepID=UPI00068B99FB|nr:PIN domain-containing protein [Lysobacter daejeonensis]
MTDHPPARPTPPAPPRLVLDTNACLDLFVFAAPEVAGLHAALRQGDVVAVTNAECRAEWLRVLRYPLLKLDEAGIAAATAAHDALVECVENQPDTGVRLPRCADPDDQKFLQLAHACGARWLLSRDKALLALARRTQRDSLFRILEPAHWQHDA